MNYDKFSGIFDSTNEIDKIAYYIYTPKAPAKGVVQISHGMCEYVERYEKFIDYLCGLGFAVCGNDHLGHGASVAGKDELGYFAPELGWTFLPRDMRKMTLIMKEKYPELPFVIFSHSMGSFITRAYMTKFDSKYDGVILCGTSGGDPALNAGLILAKTIISQFGDHYRSEKLENLISGVGNQRIPLKRTRFDWITRDTDALAEYIRDERRNFIFTARGYYDLIMLIEYINEPAWADKLNKDIPIYIISGSDDPIGNYGKSVEKVYTRLQEANHKDVEMKIYEGARHELLSELNRDEVISDIMGWINSHFFEKD